jgi:hypothetical protein
MKVVGVVISNVLMFVALVAAWQLGSAPTVAMVALTTAALMAVMFADFSRFKASGPGGFGMEAERQAARVENALAEVASAASKRVDPTTKDTSDGDARRAIEKLVGEASEWGWMAARSGMTETPRPRVDWLEDGRPRLLVEQESANHPRADPVP